MHDLSLSVNSYYLPINERREYLSFIDSTWEKCYISINEQLISLKKKTSSRCLFHKPL